MLPTCGTWPVTMGSTKASARNNAASTMRRAGETVLVFMKKSSFAQKRGLLPAFRPETDPFVASFEKNALDKKFSCMEKTGFCPHTRLRAGF